MVINPDIVDSELVKIENTNELDRVSKEIQELIKDYKEPDLFISLYLYQTQKLKL